MSDPMPSPDMPTPPAIDSTDATTARADGVAGSVPGGDHARFAQARASIEHTLGKLRDCTDDERKRLQNEFAALSDMLEKLDGGVVEIVIFGEISTGKSALINALAGEAIAAVDVQGGWTKDVQRTEWKACEYRIPGFNQSGVMLVDTPGINEVQGADRARAAIAAARRADLIVFVTDSDLNEIEHSALRELAELRKPMIVVLNKMDLYSTQQRERLRHVLAVERLQGTIPPESIILTSADPREIEVLIEDAQGNTRSEIRRPPANVGDLKARILEILDREGLALIALNAAMYAADNSDRIAALRIELRNRFAERTIYSFAVTKGLVVAFTPAVADLVGGSLVDASMVVSLGRIYGIDMSWAHARGLATAIGKAAGWVLAGEVASYIVASFFKGITFSLGTPLTAAPQMAASAWASIVVGKAAKYYFEHGASWGGRSPKAVVHEILDQLDKDSIMAELKEEIKRKMLFNKHTKDRL